MPSIPTVTGDVDVNDLGVTLMHEHIFVLTPTLHDAFPGFMGWNEETAIANAKERLIGLKAGGIDTIVDLTAPGLGRNVRRVAKVVEGTGLQVVVCTGFYTYADLPFPFKYNGPGKLVDDPKDDLLVSLFVKDIEVGIEDTGIKAGVLKCCTDEPGVTEDIDRILRAVARTHLRTDVPIATHTHPGTRRGLDQQRVFGEEGVDLGRVIIGHCNDTTDLDYLEELIHNGSFIGFDRCGLDLAAELDAQLDTLATLCERGYADRIVLSHDRHCTSDWFPEEAVVKLEPQWNFNYVQEELLPGLYERGVNKAQVDQMMVDNPRTFFAQSHK